MSNFGGANSQFEKDLHTRLRPLSERLTRLENQLQQVMIRSIENRTTSTVYWNTVRREIDSIYAEMNSVFASWSETQIPIRYRRSITQMQARIASTKGIINTAQKGVVQVLNSNASSQIVRSLYASAIDSFSIATSLGRKNMYNLTRLTQQTLINESLIDITVAAGFDLGDLRISANALSGQLWGELWGQVQDKQFVQAGRYHYTPDYYARMVARVKFHEAQSEAALVQSANYGTDLIQVSSHNTKTAICQEFEGKIFSISGKDKRFPILTQVSPYHPNCYEKNTEVLTKNGWKKIEVFDGNEYVLSLNIKTKELEYTKIKNDGLIKTYAKELIEFKNNNVCLKVTDNHRMVFCTDWSKRNNSDLEFIEAKSLINTNNGSFYAGCNWKGEQIDNISAEFYGYYMADGSVYIKNKDNGQIVISQSKIKSKIQYEKIFGCLDNFTAKHICKKADGLVFYDINLALKLKELGKSKNKRIPNFIMNADKNGIQIFLDAFIMCDGYIKKGKLWKGYNFKSEKSYFTSSKVMAGQLSELILKIGKRPSIKVQKGKAIKFKNGTYKCSDIYVIRECKSNYHNLSTMKKRIIKYDDFAYCFELEKNNTLLVKNGTGVVWCGNCLHLFFPTFESAMVVQGTLDSFSAFSKGNITRPPVPAGFIPVSKRGVA